MLAEFRSFLKTANVLPLAVGVIIGAAVGNLVSALATVTFTRCGSTVRVR